jgi:Protein of unknown function (DUF4231)
MSDLDPKAVFARHLDEAIAQFGRDRNRHKRRALGLKLSTSALGALATVLLGWQGADAAATVLKNIALIATALITLVAAYDAFYEPRKLWIRETFVLNSMKDLKRKWEIATSTGETEAVDVKAYGNEYHEILTKSLSEWVNAKQDT